MRRKSKLTSSMFRSELQTGIAYTLLAGVFRGIGPLLLKRAYSQ